jgi:very-short-patch-repair endonuclease
MTKVNEILNLARELRKNQTNAEKLFWFELKQNSFFGQKFLRQHPIFYNTLHDSADFFIPDFYCAKCKLIIEIDGAIHLERKEYDEYRDGILTELGYTILRFTNSEVETDIFTVLEIVEQKINSTT